MFSKLCNHSSETLISALRGIIGIWYHRPHHTQNHIWYHVFGSKLWYHSSESLIFVLRDIIDISYHRHYLNIICEIICDTCFWNYDIIVQKQWYLYYVTSFTYHIIDNILCKIKHDIMFLKLWYHSSEYIISVLRDTINIWYHRQ